ncbi:Ig gamma-2A chain C region, membrane-bound form, partial [Varanus komodoensis]
PVITSDIATTDEQEEELESLWTTILIFFILFLLSLCYSATVTVLKVKWLFSTVVHLKKQPSSRRYKNVLSRAI